MSDFIPGWVAMGVGVAEGEKQRRDKRQKAQQPKDDSAADDENPDQQNET